MKKIELLNSNFLQFVEENQIEFLVKGYSTESIDLAKKIQFISVSTREKVDGYEGCKFTETLLFLKLQVNEDLLSFKSSKNTHASKERYTWIDNNHFQKFNGYSIDVELELFDIFQEFDLKKAVIEYSN